MGMLLPFAAIAAEAVGVLGGDPLERLRLRPGDMPQGPARELVRFVRKTLYLNNCRAVVSHSIDHSSEFVPAALDLADRHGIKTTVFVSTQSASASSAWPRLRRAVADGHEIGSHSRTHPCVRQADESGCRRLYGEAEITGSREDIQNSTGQAYVWSWSYPCACCASQQTLHERLARAGYVVARGFRTESDDRDPAPDLQAWDSEAYNAAYTQATEGKALGTLNAKFDQVYASGGIYSLATDPQATDLAPDGVFDRHLGYISGRPDVWYVPVGPLYAYQTVWERTEVQRLKRHTLWARYAIYNDLDPKVYNMSITLEFEAPPVVRLFASGKQLREQKASFTSGWNQQYYRREGARFYITLQPNTVLEFR